MSKLGDLISELCPNGVERKTLKEIGIFIRGAGIQKSELSEYGSPAIHYGEIHVKYGISATEVFSYIEKPKSGYRQVETNDLIIVTTSEDVAGVGKPLAWMGIESPYVSGETYIYRHTQNAKYLAYLLQDKEFQIKKLTHITGTKVKRIHESAFSKISFPIPPIEVQDEIVLILDKFRELGAGLEAELEARRAQNSYYRDKIFGSDERFEFKRVRELCEIKTGKKDVNQGNPNGQFPFFTCSRSHTYSDTYSFDGEALLIAGNGEVGLVQYFDGKFEAYQRTYVLMEFRDVESRYLFQYLKAYLVEHLSTLKQDGTISYIKLGMLADFMIPIPPVAIQNEFISKFEKFEKLEFELESEIVARKLQYEFYRNHLLTFKELGAA